MTMPSWMPASRIVMPSVTMKPLSRPLTISSPLRSPTAAPTASTIRMPIKGLSIIPLPKAETGTMSQAATIGASP